MLNQKVTGRYGLDWTLFSLFLSLIAIGWTMIYSVDKHKFIDNGLINLQSNAGKQLIFIGIAFLIGFFIFFIDGKFWKVFAYLIYSFAILLLIAVLIFGVTVKGQRSWFSIGGFTFQPSEIAKLGTCLALSSYLSIYGINLKHTKSLLICLGLLLLPVLIIMIQPDAGSSLVFISFLFLLYRNGMNPLIGIFIMTFAFLFIISLMFDINLIITGLLLSGLGALMLSFNKKLWFILAYIVVIALTIIAFYFLYIDWAFIALSILCLVFSFIHFRNRKPRLAFLIIAGLALSISFSYSSFYAFNNFLKPHQQERLNVWLNPEKCDPRGALYNVLQSKMAIGSGGWTGKGFTNGILTKLNYIPEQTTDFIFCTVGEEHGFIGGLVMIGLFVWLLIRLIQLAERQRSVFSRNYMYGIAGILFIHFFINLGMTIGVMPIIGIPLPFVSYGGSSLLSFSTMIAIVLKMDSQRSAA